MNIKRILLQTHFNDLFENDVEMISALDQIIKLIESERISSKIFLSKIKIIQTEESKEITLDTGIFSDTLLIKAPKGDRNSALPSFVSAIQNSKINTLLLLFSTLKPKYRKELLLKS